MALENINMTDFATRIAVSDSQELKWLASITLGMRGRANPFHQLIGGIGDLKPVMEVADFSKIKGQEIVVTVDRPLGGPGVQGTTTLLGSEEKETHATYRAKVGQIRQAVGTEALTLAQTVIGSGWDMRAKKKLAEWFAWKMADDIQFEMIDKKHARNTLYPNGKTSRNQLTGNDFFDLSLASRVSELLAANQAGPFSARKTKSGQEVLKYLIMASQYAFRNMEDSNSYQNLLANAGARGNENLLFNGGLPDWNGTLLHKWLVEDGTQVGPKGCPIVPRAYLGTQLPATSTTDLSSTFITGHASNTTSLFFQYFSSAAYTGHEGEKIAAVTDVDRYVGIKILTGSDAGKIALYRYTTNNGNKLGGLKRLGAAASGDIETTLTGSTIEYDADPWIAAGSGNFAGISTGVVPAGSIIYECNSKGQPFVGGFGLGRDAVLTGWGAIHEGAGQHGKRIVEAQDFSEKIAIGYKQVWGARAIENADNLANGYVYFESAYTPDGWPTITT